MPLYPPLRKFLELSSQFSFNDVNQMREVYKKLSLLVQKEEVGETRDIVIRGTEADIRARIYTPIVHREKYGILVYFHGGGFVFGDIETYDHLCRSITNSCECKVVSVDYRLAPEHKFPAAVIDATDSLGWVLENMDEGLGVAVAGDSAGGNLAAVVSHTFKSKLKYQVLIYPAVGFDQTSRSMTEFSEGYFLTSEMINWFGRLYLSKESDVFDPRFSPILFKDFKNLPPALIITAEYDPLRDQGEAYANKLAENGVETVSIRFNGMIHGFLTIPDIPHSKSAIRIIGSTLKDAFYR